MTEVDIVVVGSANTDMFCYVDKFPRPGDTIFGNDFETGFGGKGANQAVCAAILGVKVVFVGSVGDDMFGKEYLDNFKANGVSTEHISVDSKQKTGVAQITVEATGENHIVVVPGANLSITKTQIHDAKSAFASAKVLICQNEINFEATQEALKYAREINPKIIRAFNPSPWATFDKEFYLLIDILVVNENELNDMLESMKIKANADDLKTKCISLMNELKLKAIVVTLGGKGAFAIALENSAEKFFSGLAHGKHVEGVKLKKEELVDTTGAGDCFLASLCVGLVKNLTLEEAVSKACKIAAESVKHKGCQASYKTLRFD